MGVDAEELIVRPFKEVVERGNEAINNAKDADDAVLGEELAKAGRAVVREGERALKRLQPIWDGQVEKYGDAFKDAMLQQDDIEKKRRLLEDLLYDFEDYVEPENFDQEKFNELQAATRSFALEVINHTKRLKLEAPKRESTASQLAAAIAGGAAAAPGGRTKMFPPLPPLPPMPPLPQNVRQSGSLTPRSSLIKAVHQRVISPIPGSPEMIDEDDQLYEGGQRGVNGTNGTNGHANGDASRPESNGSHFRENGHGGLRRTGTKSSVVTTASGASSRPDSERYPLDLPERQDSLRGKQQPNGRGHVRRPSSPTNLGDGTKQDGESKPTAGKPLVIDTSSVQSAQSANHMHSTPRTSAWVRNHQQAAGMPSSAAVAAARQRTQALRKKASRDTVATDYSSGSYDSPSSNLSRFNSIVDGSVRSAASASVFDGAPHSPALTDARTSFMSSAANSYTSSPVVSYMTPPEIPQSAYTSSPSTDLPSSRQSPGIPTTTLPPPAISPSIPTNNHTNASSSSAPAPFIAPPISSVNLPPPALSTRRSSAGGVAAEDDSQSIQDFIKFAPSPPVPPIRLPASPKLKKPIEPEPESTESEHEPDHHEPELELEPKPKPDSTPLETERENNEEPPQTPASMAPTSLPSAPSEKNFDQGLMVVEEGVVTKTISAGGTTTNSDLPLTREFVREPDCSIGPKSTFEQMGGFCKGAESFRVGGHWQGIKQTAGYVANKQTKIGRCVSCGYAHNYEEVRLDVEKKPEAAFTKSGVRFRLRLLYKSHVCNPVASQRMADSHYACIFCVHATSTVREGDATVFTTPDHLLLHLARHPQPLPQVPGLTVLYGDHIDPRDPNNQDFDLHFIRAPLPTPVPPTVASAAVATAVREHCQRYGAKKLPRPPSFGGDMLQFLAGARIVGVMFPEKWEGKWCMGWHDGFVGAFPAKVVQIEPPRQNEIPMESSSGMSVVARWKWKPRTGAAEGKESGAATASDTRSISTGTGSARLENGEKDPGSVWLTFEKGEVISNVKCLYADHWCWAGTNSKGKFGVFPQSHIITKTLAQEAVAPLRPAKSSGWGGKLFKSSSRRPVSSSNASSYSSSTGQTRYT